MEYYACDWIVRRGVNYRHLAAVANELGCQLAFAERATTRADGLVVKCVVIEVPSWAVLEQFRLQAGCNTGMADWYRVSLADYLDCAVLRLPIPPTQRVLRWLDGMRSLGSYNAYKDVQPTQRKRER